MNCLTKEMAMPTLTINPKRSVLERAEHWATRRGKSVVEVCEDLLEEFVEHVGEEDLSPPTHAAAVPLDLSRLSPNARAAMGLVKSSDMRPYKEILAEAIWEKHMGDQS